jgi:hypothetical protein
MMGEESAVPLLWRRRAAILERRVTSEDSLTWMAIRVDELTMAAAAVLPASRTDACPELELRAHVAGIRTRAPRSDGRGTCRSPGGTVARWCSSVVERPTD